MRAGLRTFLKCTLGGVVTLAALAALVLGAFGYIVGRVPEYRVQVQDWVSERSGLVVEFRTLSARLRRFGPELVFDDPVVRTPDRTRVLASASRGSIGFDLWNSIANGRLTAGRFSLDAPEIHLLRTREGRIQLLGQSSLPDREWKPVPLEYLPVGHFRVRDAVVSFRDERYETGPWSLSGVSFSLQRSVDVMALEGSAVLPRSLGRNLNFHAYVAGALEDAESLVSTFRIDGESLDLAGWVNALPPHWPVPEAGQGSLEVTGTLRGAQLEQLNAQVQMQGLVITTPVWELPLPAAQPLRTVEQQESSTPVPALAADEPRRLEYQQLTFKADASRLGSHWSLTVDDLQALREDSQWHARQIAARWSHEAGAQTLQVNADHIELDGLWPLLAYLPETQPLARLRALQPTGALNDLQLSMQRQPERAPQYSVQVELQDLGFAPIERAPGVSGLNGKVVADQQSGRMQLTAREPVFSLPWMFRAALDANLVEGQVQWRREPAAWRVYSDQLKVQADDGHGQARLSLTFPDDRSSPLIDLHARGDELQIAATPRYVRGDKLRAPVMEWFDTAFVAGQLDDVEITLKGALRRFPFRDGGGEFIGRGKVSGAHLAYQPDWQPLQQAQAQVLFRNQGMSAEVLSGDVGGLSVTGAQVDIADFRTPLLRIRGNGSGELGRGLRLVRDSPLGPVLGDLFAALDGRGALNARLNMALPLQRLREREIEVVAEVADATVTMRDVAGAVSELTGTLTIRNDLVAAANLQGQWLNGPLDVRIEQRGPTHAILDAQGEAAATALQRLLALPPAVALDGRTAWHMNMRIDSASLPEASQRSINIRSDLQGLGITLPEPVGKPASQSRDLQLTLDIDGARAMLARGSLGDLRALVRIRRATDGWLLDRGSVRADAVTPALPAHRGLRLEGSVERFVLDDWLRLGGGGSGRPLSDVLQAANVRVGEFELFGYRWPQVRGILQATEGGWRVDVEGANATGHVLIPEKFTGDQPLRASMERLVLGSADRKPVADEESTPLDPRQLPNMQMYVRDFLLGERSVGEVELRATRMSQGLRIDSVTVKGQSAHASGQGQWVQTVDGPQTNLTASVESSDVAATLRALGYTEFIQARHGAIRADLTWQGGFEGNFLGRASGAISVDAQSGQLVNLQPGAGRVLGLFSVAALPRRLALDFSDLTDKGLSFDSVHGDFELRQGDAFTSNLLLQGPAAEIGIAGRTGLGRRDYDQTAVVTGNLGASLPVAGALAGGPAVGAALLLFSQVFKEPLKGITRGYYRITGPWDEPVVERVEAGDVKASANDSP